MSDSYFLVIEYSNNRFHVMQKNKDDPEYQFSVMSAATLDELLKMKVQGKGISLILNNQMQVGTFP